MTRINQVLSNLVTIILILILTSCQFSARKMEPIIVYTPPDHRVNKLPTAFIPLTSEERQQEWATELILGDRFARELDLYRAITCYKRALILLPEEAIERHLQIDYDIILCYYLGHKYQDAIYTFEKSNLTHVNTLFPAFNNLLIILNECYRETGQCDKAETLFESIEKYSPETAQDISIYSEFKQGNLEEAEAEIQGHPYQCDIEEKLSVYYLNTKSPAKARFLNAILPGAGYYYVGQKKSALTSFIINALFTAAAYQFFNRGYIAAGAITTSLEMGWYFGGINGAGIEAQEYNTRLYEGVVKNMLYKNNLFPILMFETAF